jgi:very-short-patch-repair endonuclease
VETCGYQASDFEGGFIESPYFPLIKGDIGGFDKGILRAKGLITTGFHLPYNPNLVEIAHILRNNLTPAEKKIWYSYFCSCEFRVLRQRPIDNYIVDFYCPKYKLIIEIDGDNHFTEEGKVYDQERTATLEKYGLKVIRFQNHDVMKHMESVVKKIEEIMDVLATKKRM